MNKNKITYLLHKPTKMIGMFFQSGDGKEVCPHCLGRGKVATNVHNYGGLFSAEKVRCENCDGKGYKIYN